MSGPRRAKGTRHDVFVVTQPGLERLTAAEVRDLGVHVEGTGPGGVRARMTIAQVLAANLRLRTATRVLLRLGTFDAPSFDDLAAGVRALAWERWLGPSTPVTVSATSAASRLYHTGAVEERVLDALADRVAGLRSVAAAAADEVGAQRVLVRVKADVATVSLDTTGLRLHQRGWRQDAVAAPLRETLAAALVLAAGWDGDGPLVDPCAGSGTIVIEAAALARRLPPGRHRAFAFERWPTFDADVWRRVREAADAEVRPPLVVPLVASDRDPAAVAAARANAARAGVGDDIVVAHADLAGITAPGAGAGLVATNPPYGQRLRGTSLPGFYTQLGRVLKAHVPGWRFALVDADRTLVRRTGLLGEAVVRTHNGGLPVRFLVGTVPAARQTGRP